MHTTVYIGAAGGMAYIDDSWMRIIGKGWKHIIYYIDLDELDPAFRDELLKTKPESKSGGAARLPHEYQFGSGWLQSGSGALFLPQ
jgi:hypothetical protein